MNPAPRPYTLVAELTYACPLHCVYCSNPVDFVRHKDALDTAAWRRVLREAEQLGVVQVNLTGGEPLLQADVYELMERLPGQQQHDHDDQRVGSAFDCRHDLPIPRRSAQR